MIAAMSLVLALAPSLHAPPRLACGIARRALLPRMEDAVEEKVVAEKPEEETKPAPGGMRSPSLRSELKEQIAKDQGMLTLIPWREEMQERFEAADDGDGFINSSELGSLMTACGESLSADEVSALFKEADTNGARRARSARSHRRTRAAAVTPPHPPASIPRPVMQAMERSTIPSGIR